MTMQPEVTAKRVRVQVVRKGCRRPVQEVDLRTPSGKRRLPY